MRKIYGWVIAIPLLLVFSGALSNQLVLVANWGKFPVMLNSAQLAKMQAEKAKDEPSFSISDTVVSVAHLGHVFSSDGMIDDVHCVMSHSNHLKILADWINLGDGIYSPGDLVLILGLKLWEFAPIAWVILALRKLWSGYDPF
jgi:hypothetical protein